MFWQAILFAAYLFGATAQAGEVGPRRALLTRSAPFAPLEPGEASDCYFQFQICVDNGTAVPISNDLSITRASSETVQWQDGHLSYVGSGSFALSDKGLAIWEARTNLVLRSQAFANASWTKGVGITATDNIFAAPDLTTTASSAVSLLSANTLTQAVTVAATTTRTATVYAMVSVFGSGSLILIGGKTDGTDGCAATFGISGTVISYSSQAAEAAGSCQGTGSAVRANGNWYRLQVSYQTAGTSGGAQLTMPVSSTLALWGAQDELGSLATPYIPTVSATATRAADNIRTVSSSVLDTALRVTPGSLFIQTNAVLGTAGNPRLIVFNTGNWHVNATAANTSLVANDGTNQAVATIGGAGTWSGGRVKSSVGYISNSTSDVANNGTVATNGLMIRTTATGTVNIGGTVGNADGYIERLAVTPNQAQLFPTSP